MLRRRGRHRLDPLVRSHRGIIWCRIQFPVPHREILHQADGFSGHLNSKEQLDLLCLNSNSLSQGQVFNSPIVQMVTTVAITAEVARNFPQKQKPAQGQNSNQNSNQNKGKKQVLQVKQGRVNFTTLTELPGDAPIMRGTFSIPHKPVVTLLDSSVICSFWNKKKAWTFAI